MLRDVITSFWAQDFTQAELIIQDDASPDETAQFMGVVAGHDDRIVYTRNDTNVGLAENVRRALHLARGEYLVLLGDDDVLLGPHALERYAEAFARHSDVYFVYPNQIQMDVQLNFDFAYKHFNEDARHDPGGPSFTNTWLKSVQIAGLGLRRSDELYDFYPRSTLLFFQVGLVGRLVSRHASYAIADFLVGVRSHGDQLGFHVNQGRRIVGPERHGTIEILDIAAEITSEFGTGPDLDYTAKLLTHGLATMLPIEKVHGNTRIVVSNAVRLMQKSPVARRHPLLLLSLLLTVLTPAHLLDWFRGRAKSVVRRRHLTYGDWFASEVRRQRNTCASQWRLLELQLVEQHIDTASPPR
jgi:glycosyltransferase involved in cell wall biosynthesis